MCLSRVFFKHDTDSSRRPRINRGARQINKTQPQNINKNSKQINISEAEEVVTIQIAGEPVIIPDFEITPKPQRQKEAEIIQIPVQIQATQQIITEPKADNEVEEVANEKSSDLTLFSPTSDLFQIKTRAKSDAIQKERFPSWTAIGRTKFRAGNIGSQLGIAENF